MAALQIFKPVAGVASMEGISTTLSAADLTAIAASYDPAVHEAPLTIGHPTHDAPAYGWVKSLSFADGALMAETEQSAELGELVLKGHYKKVSSSFYTPTAPGNPTPGKWALRHVGFLGAQPPGVKGLRAVSFAETEEGVVTFGELPGYAGSTIASLFRRMRDYFIAKDGLDAADQLIPSWEVESLREISQRAAESNDLSESAVGLPTLSFAEPVKTAITQPTDSPQEKSPAMKTAEQLQTELDAANLQVKTLQGAETQRAHDTRHASHVSFAEGLVKEARWPATAKDVLVATLDAVSRPADVVSFGEGEAAKPLVDVLQEQLKAMPPAVSFAEFAGKGSGGAADMSAPAVAARAITYQTEQAAKGIVLNTAQAVAHVLQ
jgi:hypothetical protein